MNADLKLSGDSLREAVKPWLEELGKSDRERLKRLLDLSQTANTRLSDCLAALFPDDDTPTALANLTRLRKRLNDAADGDKGQGKAVLGLRFHVDTKKKSPPSQRFVWFTGPDAAVLRATRFSEQATSDIAGKPLISSKGIATTGSALAAGKRVVRFFISYAHENKGLAETLVSALRSQFGPSRRYQLELWIDREIMVGEKWHERIQRAIAECDFGLFMVSPDFLGSDYIGENELPPFLSAPTGKPVVPVGLVPVSFSRHDLKGLKENQIFFLRGRSFDQMRQAAEKTEFARHLHEEMEKRLDAWFAPPTGSRTAETPDGTESDAPRGLSVEDALDWMPRPEETRHFQRTKGFPHHLAARESLDPAKAPPGEARDALEELEAWAVRADGQPFFALLGEVGIGKTTTLKQFTRQLLEKRRKQPRKFPLPIYIDLRDYIGDRPDAVPTIEELLASVIQRSWRVADRNVTAADLLRLVREDGALILFDGLDEKIVHHTQDRARQFIRTLWSALPQAMLAGSEHSRGKMLLSCRSHYFRDVWSQNAMLTGEDREGIDHAQFPAFCLLPFDEAQIRAYLTSFLGDEKHGHAAFDLIASIHNLRDLAQRPYLLSLISGHLGELEALQLRGDTVNAARLYDLVVRSWLNRDGGKHHLEAAHKRRLMEALAAALWRSGEKQWEVDRLEDWFDDFLLQNPAISLAYANKDRALLKEDLRTATFVLRPDTEEKSFRFAHTSLQEYFLAAHLVRALREQAPAAWDLPLVSLETFEFLGQILILEPTPQAIESMGRVLGGDCVPAALLAFKYWLHAIQKGYPEPNPGRVNLAGADLEEWHVQGHAKDRPLNLRGANLRGSRLNRARIEFVDLAAADLTGCEARQALFLHVDASHAKLIEADVAGLQWRHGSLENAEGLHPSSGFEQVMHVKGIPNPKAIVGSTALATAYTGHRGTISCCAWSPSGTAFVTGSWDGSLKVWDAVSGSQIMTLAGTGAAVSCCTWALNGSLLVSGTEDGTLTTWDIVTGLVLSSLKATDETLRGMSRNPVSAAAVLIHGDAGLKVWDVSKGRLINDWEGLRGPVSLADWSPTGQTILVQAGDGRTTVHETANGHELACLMEKGADELWCCAWAPDGRQVVTGSSTGEVIIWDVASATAILTCMAPGPLCSLRWGSHERCPTWLSCSELTGIVTASGIVTMTLPPRSPTWLTQGVWSPDGRSLVTADFAGTWKVRDSRTLMPRVQGFVDRLDQHACVFPGASAAGLQTDAGWTLHALPEQQSAIISADRKHILHATSEAWRWLGWEERDARGRFIRRLPAEVFGPIPGMDD
ncbi:MAG: TIR domain-containing protein [Prosthecobacter sp.]|jgi:hypothetical protein|uniref:TIR domain-containing protein n=1 Tax=Prosthecobacter sp. TaxID=1965333 RepID=UPI0019DA3ACB|nr:TIR domain-containing protein [Prosthecobacter sp.]MBE2286506.1 TIR domain-containing protein [Prosthecobacter sp.]